MAAPVSPMWKLPRVEDTYIGNPVLGRTLVALAGALTHLNAIHARGFVPAMVWQGPAFTTAHTSDVGYPLGEVDRYETVRVPFWVPPAVDLIHVALVCLAYETGGSQVPEVTVTVEDASGVQFEDGCTWSRATGTLPGAETKVGGRYYLRPFLVESGTRFQASDPTSGPTDPRRLSVGSKAGDIVCAVISTVRTRIVAAAFYPVPPTVIG